MSADRRTEAFRRNPLLEQALEELNKDLRPSEARLAERYRGRAMRFPLVLIVSPPRSGSTLLLQWLAKTGLTAYPSNLLSRFYAAPIIGAQVQRMLADERLDFREETAGLRDGISFTSNNGKTSGALAPNEFWYFWRTFVQGAEDSVWTTDFLQQNMDGDALRSALVGMSEVFGAAFAAKGMIFNFSLPYLSSLLENLVVIRLSRDPVATVQSILAARVRQYGNDATWYSFRTPDAVRLERLDPLDQVAGQVVSMLRGIDAGLDAIHGDRVVDCRYEAFCRDPRETFEKLAAILGRRDIDYRGPDRFDPAPAVTGPAAASIRDALDRHR